MTVAAQQNNRNAQHAQHEGQHEKSDFEQLLERDFKITAPRLPYPEGVKERFGIDKTTWRALVEAVFPNASTVESIILALSYCRSRKLDVMKRPIQIVPIWSKAKGSLVDTIWPGIGELRTTAFRTNVYAGRDRAVFGPDIKKVVGKTEITFPEWCEVTIYRIVGGHRVAFVGPRVYWLETYATVRRDDDTPNEMWATRTYGQIEKCAEAAALRAAFPEEIGDYIPEELGRASRDGVSEPSETPKNGEPAARMSMRGSVPRQPLPQPAEDLPAEEPAPIQQAPVQAPAAATPPTWNKLSEIGITRIDVPEGIAVQNADGQTLRPDGVWDDQYTDWTVQPSSPEQDALARSMAEKFAKAPTVAPTATEQASPAKKSTRPQTRA
jgi:phage recombination protein Bet